MRISSTLLLLLAALACAVTTFSNADNSHVFQFDGDKTYPGYGKRDPNAKLNIHFNCHTHDDVGWLKNLDQYLSGGNSTYANADVHLILDSVVQQLELNPNRRFIYVEQAFFFRWFNRQTEKKKKSVLNLVQRGQLEFINGGWVMHDEAAAHYLSMIEQTTLGHTLIKYIFDKTPKAGWQIDPFGHSSTQPTFVGALAGLDSVFFARISFNDRDERRKDKALEFLWAPSPSLGQSVSSFAGVFVTGNYGAPGGFCFDSKCGDEVIQDNELMDGYNVDQIVENFVHQMHDFSATVQGNDILINLGDDFQYQNALKNYENVDKLIDILNKDGRVNAFYSTPSEYAAAKLAYTKSKAVEDVKEADAEVGRTTIEPQPFTKWPIVDHDFFPYADGQDSYWSGYFSSRSTSKRMERVSLSTLTAARQLDLLSFVLSGGKKEAVETQVKPSSAIEKVKGAIDKKLKQRLEASPIIKDDGLFSLNWNEIYEDVASALIEQSKKSTLSEEDRLSIKRIVYEEGDKRDNATRALFALEDALSIMQHHDAVSGTEKQHVAFDYAKRMGIGLDLIAEEAKKQANVIASRGDKKDNEIASLFDFQFCALLNESKCDLTQDIGRKKLHTIHLDTEVQEQKALGGANGQTKTLLASSKDIAEVGAPAGPKGLLDSIVISAHNPLSKPSDAFLQIPVAGPYVQLFDAQNKPVLADVVYSFAIDLIPGTSKYTLYAQLPSLPALGTSSFVLRTSKDSILVTPLDRLDSPSSANQVHSIVPAPGGDFFVQSKQVHVRFNKNGEIQAVSQASNGLTIDVKQDIVSLKPYVNNGQNSGAYILRTFDSLDAPSNTYTYGSTGNIEVIAGRVITEVRRTVGDKRTEIAVRLVAEEKNVVFDYVISNVDISKGGQEIFTVYTTDIQTGTNARDAKGVAEPIWYTDSNGREFQRRKYSSNQLGGNGVLTALNTQPATSAAFIAGKVPDTPKAFNGLFGVVLDRSEAVSGTSKPGQLAVLIFRRLLEDDARGVGEPMDETDVTVYDNGNLKRSGNGIVARINHVGVFGFSDPASVMDSDIYTDAKNPVSGSVRASNDNLIRDVRFAMDKQVFAPYYLFADSSSTTDVYPVTTDSKAKYHLPSDASLLNSNAVPTQVTVLSLKRVGTSHILIRLGHQFAVFEDSELSTPVNVDIAGLLKNVKVTEVVETSITANQVKNSITQGQIEKSNILIASGDISDAEKNSLKTKIAELEKEIADKAQTKTTVIINPMEIKTFLAKVEF